ncbi:hypothetical protein B9P99_01440 [Candidatus Marsarchaeota G1 archaeon OSP_B]|uniref:Methyltransferase small domain-containing protein n=4 Tax=Candidatus Marsarchaeota group 1 TaxID=2203770 RepID=A0A2R6AHY5_9ARCH|nr:MAG: hypothetical protein B9Q01_00715 [Candidatus Marsarchaeota G1 archaeon OSP_D]PSN85958.1 MAG: hypothetical protein B9Q02_04195 [Candidatus Marsarchaeota G1 archaeon BE_D]PSN88446.1 MAG: hypothetical protein B9Q00_05400 [Candidatus Marsarchaeota G1 archaeon OSP_C]PSN94888.1 MAG: hypothetical protein B9P99_01440 [Candidatus Marsarchaeota G1 archaeon OSP_B]
MKSFTISQFNYDEFTIFVYPHVYKPSDDTYMLANVLKKCKKVDVAIEFGTGCGLLSLIASKIAKVVIAYETNVYAFRNALKNIKLNQLQNKIFVFLDEGINCPQAELIFMNPPYLSDLPLGYQDVEAQNWYGGPDGVRIFLRILNLISRKLTKNGKLLFVASSTQNKPILHKALRMYGFSWEIAVSKRYFYETIEIYKCTKNERTKSDICRL